MKDLIKRQLSSTGVLKGFHYLRNRGSLTVVMFHRVLDETDPRWSEADPQYTMSAELFHGCLGFLQSHYEVIGLSDVLDALERKRPLPPLPLLITFDDGWADTEEVAAPLLADRKLPAALFLTASALDSCDLFWEEAVIAALRTKRLGDDQLRRLWAQGGPEPFPTSSDQESIARRTVDRLRARQDARLIVADLLGGLARVPRPMLSRQQLGQLLSNRFQLGVHGCSHAPLTVVSRPDQELDASYRMLAELDVPDGSRLPAMSFPHGSYTRETVQLALETGFRLLFTSQPCLNDLSGGWVRSPVLGRVEIAAHAVSDASGRLRADLLGLWLFTRPSRVCE